MPQTDDPNNLSSQPSGFQLDLSQEQPVAPTDSPSGFQIEFEAAPPEPQVAEQPVAPQTVTIPDQLPAPAQETGTDAYLRVNGINDQSDPLQVQLAVERFKTDVLLPRAQQTKAPTETFNLYEKQLEQQLALRDARIAQARASGAIEEAQSSSAVTDFGASVVNGFTSAAGDLAKGVGDLVRLNDSETAQFVGQKLREIGTEFNDLTHIDVDHPEAWYNQAGGALGQIGSLLIPGSVASKLLAKFGKVTTLGRAMISAGLTTEAGAQGVAQGFDEFLRDRGNEPLTEDQYQKLAMGNFALNTFDSVLPVGFLKKLSPKFLQAVVAGGGPIGGAARGGATQGIIGALQSYGSGELAKAVYDADPEAGAQLAQAVQEGKVGGMTGAILGAIFGRRARFDADNAASIENTPAPTTDTSLAGSASAPAAPAVPDRIGVVPLDPQTVAAQLSPTNDRISIDGGVAIGVDPANIVQRNGKPYLANPRGELGVRLLTPLNGNETDGYTMANPDAPVDNKPVTLTSEPGVAVDATLTAEEPVPAPRQAQLPARTSRGASVFTLYRKWWLSGGLLRDTDSLGPVSKFFAKKFGNVSNVSGVDRVLHRADQQLRVSDESIKQRATVFRRELEDHGPKTIDAAFVGEISAALRGDQNALASHPKIRAAVDGMRATIDERSKQMADELNTSIRSLIARRDALQGPEASIAPMRKELQDAIDYQSNRVRAIESNYGSYVKNTYAMFTDAVYRRQVLKDATRQRGARQFFYAYYRDHFPQSTEADRNGYADNQLRRLLGIASSPEALQTRLNFDTQLKQNFDALKNRKRLPPAIRELLGEYKDPLINYATTISELDHEIGTLQLSKRIRSLGEGQGWLSRLPQGANIERITTTGGLGTDFLHGMYAPPDVAAGLHDFYAVDNTPDNIIRHISKASSFIKEGWTVLSPATAIRNFAAGPYFLMFNGDFTNASMSHAARETWRHLLGGDVTAYIQQLRWLGVVGDSVNANAVRTHAIDTATLFSDIFTGLDGADTAHVGKGRRATRRTLDLMYRVYGAGDDLWKMMAFESKRAALAEAYNTNVNDPRVMEEAAQRVRDTYPSYSKVNRLVKKTRAHVLTAPFITFSAEMYRTSKNTISQGWRDIHSDNPAIRRMGVKSLLSASATGAAMVVAAKALSQLAPETEEAVREVLDGGFYEGPGTVLWGLSPDGELKFTDTKYYIPYSSITEAVGIVLGGGAEQDALDRLTGATNSLVSPFLQLGIAPGVVKDVADGMEEYSKSQDLPQTLVNTSKKLAGSLSPTLLRQVVNVGKSMASTNITNFGTPKSTGLEALKIVGVSVLSVSLQKELHFSAQRFSGVRTAERRRVKDAFASIKSTGGDRALVVDAEARIGAAWNTMVKKIQAMQVLGVSNARIKASLKGVVSEADVLRMLRGLPPEPLTYDEKGVAEAVRQTKAFAGQSAAEEVRSRLDQLRSKSGL